MTPERHAEIRAYIQRLDLDQLPGWTVEQAIIRDLWEVLPQAWDESFDAGRVYQAAVDGWYRDGGEEPDWPTAPRQPANPYRDGDR
jgi:hypothetical protein